MLSNYIKIAFRNLLKNKGYSFINIFGLCVGLASCFLIALYINYEFSYEHFHQNKEEIYRLIPRGERNGVATAQTWTPPALANDLIELREVESTTRISFQGTGNLIQYEQESLDNGAGLILVDSSFFNMFSYELAIGNPDNVLDQAFQLVISESVADTYFDSRNPIGEVLTYEGKHDFVITGVMRDMPENTHIRADFIGSFLSLQPIAESFGLPPGFDLLDDYSSSNYSTYALIPNNEADADLEERISLMVDEARGREPGSSNFTLQPLLDIHFETGIKADTANGNINFVYAFSVIALFILVIASFNFINLTTARSLRRAREVGVRKALGAKKGQLIYQFLGETIFVALFSIILALFLLDVAARPFGELMGSAVTFSLFDSGSLLLVLFISGMIAAVLAGFYPAFYLSRFNPIKALKNEEVASGKSSIRKVLSVIQFGIASFLTVGMITVYTQMDYINNKDLGFNQDQVVYSYAPAEIAQDNFEAFKSNLLQSTAIENVTRTNKLPGMVNSTWTYEYISDEGPQRTNINTYVVDPEFVNMLDLEMAEGRNMEWERPTDFTDGYIINETAAKAFGLEDPLTTGFRVLDNAHEQGRIIGVVKDFHYNSLHKPIEPLVMWHSKQNSYLIAVNIQANNIEEGIRMIESEWKRFAPSHSFTYSFLDESFAQQYLAEQNFTTLITAFTVLAIFISCLGLFGLTTFMVEQRKKEIGVRKVLGATVQNIVVLFSSDFSKLIAIAFVIMIPVAYLVSNNWLENFAYRIDQSIVTYVIAGISIMVIALATISYQSIKAALTNPVDILKDE